MPKQTAKKTAAQVNEEFRGHCTYLLSLAKGQRNAEIRADIADDPNYAWSVHSALVAVCSGCPKVAGSVIDLTTEVGLTLTPERRANPIKTRYPYFNDVLDVVNNMMSDPLGGLFFYPSIVREAPAKKRAA